ncbi:hypothetical protein B0H10DRAFT_1946682 [Mycena sp. CBHHK59/15]|nr:hypothetical protein B0H10DRAFT_1946682 [Mycena sp. CBHHK59/15]
MYVFVIGFQSEVLTTSDQWRRRLQLEGWCFLSPQSHLRSRPFPYLGPDQGQGIQNRAKTEERTSEKCPVWGTWVDDRLRQRPWTAETGGVSVIFAAQTRALDFSEEIFVWKRACNTHRLGKVYRIGESAGRFGMPRVLVSELGGKDQGVARGDSTLHVIGY